MTGFYRWLVGAVEVGAIVGAFVALGLAFAAVLR